MEYKSLQLWAAVLLLVGGLVHLIPNLYSALSELTGGSPWIQMVVGLLSVVVSLVMFAGGERHEITAETPEAKPAEPEPLP